MPEEVLCVTQVIINHCSAKSFNVALNATGFFCESFTVQFISKRAYTLYAQKPNEINKMYQQQSHDVKSPSSLAFLFMTSLDFASTDTFGD